MITTTMRPAFSMVMAIIVMVLMAAIAAMVLSLTARTTRSTTAQYQKEQAYLLARSYTEYAIMAASANDRSVDCIDTISATNVLDNYAVTLNLRYIGDNAQSNINTCTNAVDVAGMNGLHLIVDAYVRYPDPDHPSDRNITYHKRTLQKL